MERIRERVVLILLFGVIGVQCQGLSFSQMQSMFNQMTGGGGAGGSGSPAGMMATLAAMGGKPTAAPAAPAAAKPNPLSELLGGRQKLSDACSYLKSRTSIWGKNNAPFKLETDGFYGDVRRGYPIEVAIKPWSQFQPDNFTDFVIYATVAGASGVGAFEAQVMQGMPGPTLLGVFKVVNDYAAGARGFMCDPRAMGPDAFGSAEERRILINRALKPENQYWKTRQPAIRQYAAALWYPTEMAMGAANIRFTAKVKSDGHWYELKSKVLTPYNPPDPWQSMAASISQYQRMQQHMRQLERQAKGPPP
ncbi:hypothetical protein LOTGIDRAFT_234386 [Lottia gigantea]|uniref:Reelin domain-containing protein n=1 Tax=Lottia gigantea TaxID=225164 RepID=V3ZCJ1_LOTGI|nr:hypothetical protein LOTGIDRAFT_234386 [Lottia gigantea]ESO88788.1 hypothetical protein LOTGIDRAFT_234386 [Lottia gigantea]